MSIKILAAMKKCLILVIIMPKYYDDSNKLVIAKMKDETSNDWRIYWIEAKIAFILGRRQ